MSIQLFVPAFAVDECLAAIRECLEAGWTGLGFKTLDFEKAWCEYTGLPHAHFLNSATSGLHLAVNILRETERWSDGDEIITSPVTFVSTNHAILYERLTPVFADVDDALCLNADDVERRITARTRAVMFVGMGGNTGQFDRIVACCRRHGLRLILDAAHMAGTTLNGSTPRADVSVYSFHAVKPLPTADSGMICFADGVLDALARKKSWLGISKDTYSRSTSDAAYRWKYDVDHLGFKYHGNSIMAAIGLTQLRHLEAHCAYRRWLGDLYDREFVNADHVGLIRMAPGCISSRHLYQIHVAHRDELIVRLNSAEIFPGVHYRDNREYPMYAQERDTCPNATRLSARVVSLPLHIHMTEDDAVRVARSVIAAADRLDLAGVPVGHAPAAWRASRE